MHSPAWLTISWQQLQHHCWLASEPQRPTCLLLPGTGITRMGHHTQLFYKGWGIWLGSSCTLSTELSPQPQSHNSVCPSVIFLYHTFSTLFSSQLLLLIIWHTTCTKIFLASTEKPENSCPSSGGPSHWTTLERNTQLQFFVAYPKSITSE